ncbi:MAG: hypothetical protein WCS52_10605 [bacterium]
MDTPLNNVAAYYLRTPDGTVYGPVDIVTLCLWATDARVIPGCELSERQDVWFPVEAIPELRLNWSVQLMDGSFYGPLNLLAIRLLASENSIPAGARVCERGTARDTILSDAMIPLLVEEFHQMLAGCGALMSATLGAAQSAREERFEAVRAAEERGAQLEAMRIKLEKTEADLAAAVMSAADFGAKFLLADRTLKQEQTRSGHEQGKAAQVVAAHEALLKKNGQDLADAKLAAAELESKLKQTGQDLADARLVAVDWESKLKQAGQDLADARVVVADWESKYAVTERALILEQERAGKELGKAAQLSGEAEALARRIETAQNALREKETGIQRLEEALAERQAVAERQERETRAEMTALEKALRTTLGSVEGQFEALQKASARKEKESSDKLRQFEKEVKASTEQVAKTLREMEQRERQCRDLQNEINQRKREVAQRGAVVEVDVIHAELLHAEPVGGPKEAEDWITPPGTGKSSSHQQGTAAPKPGVLNSVEARLQNELRQWEVLKRDQKSQKKNSPKWF